jgi:hypothetical protein
MSGRRKLDATPSRPVISYFESRLLSHLAAARGQKILMKIHVPAGQTPFASLKSSWLPSTQQKLVTVDNENRDDRNRVSIKHEVAAGVGELLCRV